MIERWFPCREVSANSNGGWGSGNTERNLFTWFAARPTAQAKAAVICSLLPWPDDEAEQERLQVLVQEAMTGRYAAWEQLRAEILIANPDGASVLDPFSGRGMIPLEAARLGLPSYGIDYSPVATLAGHLLADFPFRDWEAEPELLLPPTDEGRLYEQRPRLLRDVETVLAEVGRRWASSMQEFYPRVNDRQPWGYLWAVTLPCLDCGHRFPLVGDYELRKAGLRKEPGTGTQFQDLGQSYYIQGDLDTGVFSVVVHDGEPQRTPVLANARDREGKKIRGKAAVCPHCGHPHPVKTHQRLAGEGLGRDALLLVADLDPRVGKSYRVPTAEEELAAVSATKALAVEEPFSPVLSAIPEEPIPPEIGALIRPQLYGALTYGDLMCDRQTLGTVRLARCISTASAVLAGAGVSPEYVRALTGYAAAALIRKLRQSTRGCALRPSLSSIRDLYANQGTINFSYDFFETGIGDGPGTWESLTNSTLSTLKSLMTDLRGTPTEVSIGSALALPMRDQSVSVVVTDPPYDALIYYSDSSDFFYTWIKRALAPAFPELTVSSDARGLQNKAEEIIVWGHRSGPDEHRNRQHYDAHIARAFAEMRRVVSRDGLVTIVFGHGEPEVWQRLLGAISNAGLVMTASWPANTEAGGANGGMASIETTLTMACRPAPLKRETGRKGAVEAELKAEIRSRYPDWERWGLAPADMLMAAAGPAMEVVGRYSAVLDARGEPVDLYMFLPLARAAVQDAMAVEIDHHPLETFDARTRFALWWVRLYGRQVQAKSELRWQALASSLDLVEVRDLIPEAEKGVRFTTAVQFSVEIHDDSAVIDVALALAAASDDGLPAMGEVLASSGRSADDAYLWATVQFLADRLPDSDPDAVAFTRVSRTRSGIANAVATATATKESSWGRTQAEEAQLRLLS
jgi:adenine-specific DNA methylase